MSIWKMFGSGVEQVSHHKKLFLLFYAPNLLLAYILTVPVRRALQQVIGHSLMSEKVAHSVNIAFLVEFSRERPGLLPALLGGLGAAMLVMLVLNSLLLGGAVSSLTLRRSSAWSEVFTDAAAYFGRFFRLLLLALASYVVTILLTVFLSRLLAIVGGGMAGSSGRFVGRLLGLVLLILGVLFVNQIFDYAKILTTRYDEPRAWQALRRALRFIFKERHFWHTLGLYYLVTAFAVMAVILYNFGASWLDSSNTVFIILLFGWQQVFILVKIGIRLLYYGSQAMYVNTQLPHVEPLQPTELLA